MNELAEKDRYWRIFAVLQHLPSGCWTSYGDVAKAADLPGYHRYVVRVLNEASDAGLPWHRVLRADGRSGFPEGSPA
jgi:methylated-DNA-protein-cysteine methyltransferase-like protein